MVSYKFPFIFASYFQEVLNSSILSSDTSEIQLHKDGSWSIQCAEKKIPKAEKVALEDSIEIISDDVEVVSGSSVPAATSSTDKEKNEKEKVKEKEVVDLTLSDSDDDEPLAKRRNVGNPKPDSTIKFSGEFRFRLLFL